MAQPDPKSNITSSDNPLAMGGRMPVPAPVRGPVPQQGPLDPKSNFTSADNPLARPSYYR